MARITIVVPAYNERENLARVLAAIDEVFAKLPDEFELLFVDDGSTDGTRGELIRLAGEDKRVRYISFAENAGQQAATSAGLMHASGDAVMIMDADLQHPPRLIPAFIEKWREGFPLVLGRRDNRAEEPLGRKVTSVIANLLIGLRSGVRLPADVADFCIMDLSVADRFKKLPPEKVMTRYRLAKLAKKRAYLPFALTERAGGQSKYTLGKLLRLLADSLLGRASSGKPLYTIAASNLDLHA